MKVIQYNAMKYKVDTTIFYITIVSSLTWLPSTLAKQDEKSCLELGPHGGSVCMAAKSARLGLVSLPGAQRSMRQTHAGSVRQNATLICS